jgi:hypothetical protein
MLTNNRFCEATHAALRAREINMARKPTGRALGRPPKTFDWEKIKQAAYVQCSQNEICHIFDTTPETLEAACLRDLNEHFSDFYKKSAEGGKSSLRREMYKKAMSGNVPMMIWLSKNYMGMKENWNLPENIAPIVLAYQPKPKELDDAN